MLTRRQLVARGLAAGALAALPGAGCGLTRGAGAGAGAWGASWVNDIHSGLNRTRVAGIARPASLDEVVALVVRARRQGRALSIAGGRHAMGGQQFGTDTLLLDASRLAGIGEFDAVRGQVEVGAGTQWPQLVEELAARQAGATRGPGAPPVWGIVQKQTGADRLSIGGSLSANVHGRGLTLRPFVQDIEAFTLVDARGEPRRCSRRENPELFALAIGGYGLFGVITSVRLRLAPRVKLRRVVELGQLAALPTRFAARIAQGYAFGDFQFATDLVGEQGLRDGVFSCYLPVPDEVPVPEGQRELRREDWLELLALGHRDRAAAFRRYSEYYLSTDGQIDFSDTHQLSEYIDDYHAVLGARLAGQQGGGEMITEIYVPRDELPAFMEEARADLRAGAADLIYGTVRLIERDDETLLAWARQPWACVIFNLHTERDEAALAATAGRFRQLIERARRRGGSYYLTYHRWASREQVLACHPKIVEFLAAKEHHDPEGRFASDWWRHHRALCAGAP